MSYRGLYKRQALDSEDTYVTNRSKKTKQSKKKSDHKHIYTKIILETEYKESYFGRKQVAYIADVCLQCGRVQNLKGAEIRKYDDFFKRDFLTFTLDPDEVEKAYPDLPIYTATRGKHWNNFSEFTLKEESYEEQLTRGKKVIEVDGNVYEPENCIKNGMQCVCKTCNNIECKDFECNICGDCGEYTESCRRKV